MRCTDARPVSFFRSDRFFCVSGDWYFSTREKAEFGPFHSLEQAQNSLSRYLETQSIIHYLRGADPTMTPDEESPEYLVARLCRAFVTEDQPATRAR